jgi:hypothetical protein
VAPLATGGASPGTVAQAGRSPVNDHHGCCANAANTVTITKVNGSTVIILAIGFAIDREEYSSSNAGYAAPPRLVVLRQLEAARHILSINAYPQIPQFHPTCAATQARATKARLRLGCRQSSRPVRHQAA